MSSAASRTPIGCIVLAAGSSKRFGSDKRNYRLPGGTTMIDLTLALLHPLFTHHVLVLKPGDDELARRFGDDWHIVTAEQASLGMGHSLAAAMHAAADWQGAVIALADMPWVQPKSIAAIRDAMKSDVLVVPYFQGQRGNPVGIGSMYFAQLAALQGDSGARQLMQEFSDRTVRLDLDDPGLVRDLDTPP